MTLFRNDLDAARDIVDEEQRRIEKLGLDYSTRRTRVSIVHTREDLILILQTLLRIEKIMSKIYTVLIFIAGMGFGYAFFTNYF